MHRRLLAAAAGLLLALSGCASGEEAAPASSEERAEVSEAERDRAAAVDEPTAERAQRRDRGVRLASVGRFEAPIHVTAPPSDRRRVFVVERGGTVRVLRDGRRVARPFLDISSDLTTDGERGLLSMAFAPDYARSGRLYLYRTNRQGTILVEEWRRSRRSPDQADRASRRTVISMPHGEYPNHNGGQVAFGPDGLLYFGPGDGGGGGDPLENGQRLSSLLGKIVRIDPRRRSGRPYSVPSSNPFVRRSGARPEIYAYGLRNPFRFSFDRRTGDLTIADQGQDEYEEVNFAARGRARGANFGWDVFEGRHRYESGAAPGAREPAVELPHSDGYCSVTGGHVVRDRSLGRLYGRYVYSDLCSNGLRSVRLTASGGRADGPLRLSVPSIASFGEDARGRVYAISIEGPVYRLVAR